MQNLKDWLLLLFGIALFVLLIILVFWLLKSFFSFFIDFTRRKRNRNQCKNMVFSLIGSVNRKLNFNQLTEPDKLTFIGEFRLIMSQNRTGLIHIDRQNDQCKVVLGLKYEKLIVKNLDKYGKRFIIHAYSTKGQVREYYYSLVSDFKGKNSDSAAQLITRSEAIAGNPFVCIVSTENGVGLFEIDQCSNDLSSILLLPIYSHLEFEPIKPGISRFAQPSYYLVKTESGSGLSHFNTNGFTLILEPKYKSLTIDFENGLVKTEIFDYLLLGESKILAVEETIVKRVYVDSGYYDGVINTDRIVYIFRNRSNMYGVFGVKADKRIDIISPLYDEILPHADGLFTVRIGQKYGIVETNLQHTTVVLEIEYEDIKCFYSRLYHEHSGGPFWSDFSFERVKSVSVFVVIKNGHYGLIARNHHKNHILLDFEYTSMKVNQTDKENQFSVITNSGRYVLRISSGIVNLALIQSNYS